MNSIESIEETVKYIQSIQDFNPEIGIVLGSGLGNFSSEIDLEFELAYEDIPNFPIVTVKGHSGKLLFGSIAGKKVMAMSGRFHYYEGYEMEQVVFPIRVMKFLGCKLVVISNASGGMNPAQRVGDLMIITDHINLQPVHPLRGKNDERLGPRFPDMLKAYNPKYVEIASRIAKENNITCHQGVYVGVQGPTFETPAEYKAFHILGGDAVGMSTVPEVIAARHCGLEVFGISVISDCGYPPEAMFDINHDMVIAAAKEAEPKMSLIIKELIREISF
ncbi:MAG: purine-nucleoside phosphorylase [Chitinophagales bacterium]|nr:purine-nucleoside phosphorylase [Chitinophagales bacterium]